MDVISLAARLTEPPTTARLQAFLGEVQARLVPSQRTAMERWASVGPFEADVLHRLRQGLHTPTELRFQSKRLAQDDRAKELVDGNLAVVTRLIASAATKPAVVSALIWDRVGNTDAALASHLVQLVRERAGLPGMRRRIVADEPQSLVNDHGPHLGWFVDRQCEDMASWLEAVPPAAGDTLGATRGAIQSQREQARRIARDELAAFLEQAARFLLRLSTQRLDPLGYPLERDAQFVADPPLEQRIELAAWARQAGHELCLPGEIVVLRIPIASPWTLRLELIAAELGRGACGGCGLLIRLAGDQSLASPTPAPIMLCLPEESFEERGGRFERWLGWAYPHAVDAWRPCS